MLCFSINGEEHSIDVDSDMPLLWVLRDTLGRDWHKIRLRHRAMPRLHRAY